MPLPTPDAYNDAVQTPRLAFSDPVLAGGSVDCNGFGIPKALGGGFAITYRVSGGGRAFAVRCFHKEVRDLQDRYRLIHGCLRSDKPACFVEFDYQQSGIRVRGNPYPIVKMEWVAAPTLGEYVEANHRNRRAMEQLRERFATLEQDLSRRGVAHGDLQNGNVLVDSHRLRLVDYDGMFVPGMPLGNGTELGHKHFQHPLRRATDFGPDIDRFSFIVLDLSLRALSVRPDLFGRFSTGENLLFSANDFADPDSSPVFQVLAQVDDSRLRRSLADFACLCRADFKSIPRLKEFLAGTSVPGPTSHPSVTAPDVAAYIAALPVVDASSFEAVCRHVGDRVELVGQVVEVKAGSTRRRSPYVFINFRDWRDNCVRVTIWSEGLQALGYTPDASWVGEWISVNGMIDPVYHGKNRYKTISYVSVGPTVADGSQIHKVSREEAHWRLGKGPRTGTAGASRPATGIPDRNAAVLSQLGGARAAAQQRPPTASPSRAGGYTKPTAPPGSGTSGRATAPSPVKSHNEQVLQKIGLASPPSSSKPGTPGPQGKQEPKGCAKLMAMLAGCILALVAYLLIHGR